MQLSDVDDLADRLEGIGRTTSCGLSRWQHHGRLIAREVDETHIVIRADFDYRSMALRRPPTTFSVPNRFAKHMMVVADPSVADVGAVEDPLEAAWFLQRADG